MGRPSKMTPERVDRLITAMRAGNYLQVACEYAGIGTSTLHDWLDKGRAEANRRENGEEPDESLDRYVDLRERVEMARAEAEVQNLAMIRRAANDGSWQAAAWFLERSFPARWSKKERPVEITGPQGGPVAVEAHVSASALEDKVADILASIGGQVAAARDADETADQADQADGAA